MRGWKHMEGKEQAASSGSSSSFTSELFGSKDSSCSSGIFGSIFAPTPKVVGRESLRSEVEGKKQDSSSEAWNSKLGPPGDGSKNNGGGSQGLPNRDMSSMYQEQKAQPCHLSSSIYYGGQDIYNHPRNPQGSNMNSVFKKDGTNDDGSASRGNWWQGSLYY